MDRLIAFVRRNWAPLIFMGGIVIFSGVLSFYVVAPADARRVGFICMSEKHSVTDCLAFCARVDAHHPSCKSAVLEQVR